MMCTLPSIHVLGEGPLGFRGPGRVHCSTPLRAGPDLRDGELVLNYLDVHHLLACHCWTTVVEEEEPRDPRVSGKSDGMPV